MHSLANPGDLRRLEERVASLTDDDARHWGSMTVHQAVMHVRQSLRAAEGEFDVDRAVLARELKRFASQGRADGSFPDHPMFGPMSFADWMRWGYLHTDHHLRQFGR